MGGGFRKRVVKGSSTGQGLKMVKKGGLSDKNKLKVVSMIENKRKWAKVSGWAKKWAAGFGNG